MMFICPYCLKFQVASLGRKNKHEIWKLSVESRILAMVNNSLKHMMFQMEVWNYHGGGFVERHVFVINYGIYYLYH